MCFKTSDWIALCAAIVALGALIWTIRESVITSDKLKLIDRPKIGLMGIHLIPYESKTAQEFKAINWGDEDPLIFLTSSKSLFDYGKYVRVSVLEQDKIRLHGQVDLVNKGILEASNLKCCIVPYFNGKEIEEKEEFSCVNPLLPDETFNIRFICLMPAKKLRHNKDKLCLRLKLEYDGPNRRHYNPADFWYIYNSKTNNWNHCSERECRECNE